MESGTAVISLAYVGGPIQPLPSADLVERYRRFWRMSGRRRSSDSESESRVSDTTPETALYRSTPAQPDWTDRTLRSLRDSVVPSPQDPADDGRWLSQDTVNAASDFLLGVADLLPGEPFIYSSRAGEFVAEFASRPGSLTAVVSQECVLLFAAVDGVPVTREVRDSRRLREEVQQMTRALRSGQHGSLEAGR